MFENMLNETLKVNEEEIKAMGQIKYEKPVEGASQSAQENAEVDAAQKTVDITPELVDGLIKKIPELEGIEVDTLLKGMVIEMEHAKTVDNSLETVAKIAADRIKEFPGKDYYAALTTMEDGLKVVEEPVKEEPSEEKEPSKDESGEGESEKDSEEEEDEEYGEEEIEEAKKRRGLASKADALKALKADKKPRKIRRIRKTKNK